MMPPGARVAVLGLALLASAFGFSPAQCDSQCAALARSRRRVAAAPLLAKSPPKTAPKFADDDDDAADELEAFGDVDADDALLIDALLGELDELDDGKADLGDDDDDSLLEALLEGDDDGEAGTEDDASYFGLDEESTPKSSGKANLSRTKPAAEEVSEDDSDDETEEDDDSEAVSADSLAELLKMGQVSDDLMDEDEWLLAKESYDEDEQRRATLREKRRVQQLEEQKLAEARGIGLLTNDPLCRAIVVCITCGTEADNATVATFRDLLKEQFGPVVEMAHNVDSEPEEDLPFFEVWLEGYRYLVLHSRASRGDGDLTDEGMHRLAGIIAGEVSDEAREVMGTYVGFEGNDGE
ncbi:hypothetical protein M885DRAFT_586151 [Pelagophyceae sp. CCMP2097]|nr:hypothetical protein M885DRAFT_586151 [Pelagophyceae sp. CCMP2097]